VPDDRSGDGPRRSDDRGRPPRPARAGDRGRPGPRGSRGQGGSRGQARGPAGDREPRRAPRGERETPRQGPPGLDVPTGAHEPIGRDRARDRGAGAPPRVRRQSAGVARPPLPDDEEPQLPRAVRREIDRVVGANRRGRDVALALSIGSAAIDEDEIELALQMLAWAKDQAPKVAAVREAYGVARYLAGDFAAALSELQAYRRLTGRRDQNHLVADCLRALGRDQAKVVEVAQELVADDTAPADRRIEAAIVWAASLADGGDVAAGRAVLRRVLRPGDDAEHQLRARYLAADLALRAGDRDEARRLFEDVAAAAPDFLDVEDRLAALVG
jgi:hypothetical protein